jgi:hypothetical protein
MKQGFDTIAKPLSYVLFREHVTFVALILNPLPFGRGTSIRLLFSHREKGLGDEG